MPTTEIKAEPVRLPLRERVLAVLRFDHWFSSRSSRRGDKRTSDSEGPRHKAKSSKQCSKTSKGSSTERSSRKKAKTDALPQQQQQQQKPKVNTAPGAKIANYEPSPQVRRNSSVSGPLNSSASPRNSPSRRGSQSVPVSGELAKSATLGRSSSRSVSRLRDQYVKVMLKLGDMSNQSIALGNSVQFESHAFESELIRKRSQAENEMMEYYLHSSIQPSEWKDAHMGSRIMRNSGNLSY